jgi:serine protease inhibitor
LSTEQKADFFTWDGKTQAVKMMNKVERLEYVEDKEKQVCILPYKTDDNPAGPRWKAAIVLPKRKGLSAMQDILKNFAASPSILGSLLMGDSPSSLPRLSSVMQKLIPQKRPQPVQGSSGTSTHPSRSQKIHLSLPSFSLKLNLDLIPPLQKLGLGPAFKLSDDFAPISKEQLLITRATHDLFLEVNEEGTEMAAVTTIGMRLVGFLFGVNKRFEFRAFGISPSLQTKPRY